MSTALETPSIPKHRSPLDAEVALSRSNPALDDVPELTRVSEICSRLEQTHAVGSASDAYDHTPKEVLGYAVKRLLRAMHDSALVRDVTNYDYQPYLYGAFNFLSYLRNAHGGVVQSASVSLPGAVARTMIICCQEGAQNNAVRNAILNLFDDKGRVTVVGTRNGGFMRTPRKAVLHVPCPPDCDPTTLILWALQEFNGAFGINMTQKSLGLVSGGQFPDARVLCSMAIGGNFGAILISGIRAGDARSRRAKTFFAMLATVAQTTGVVILILCTTGAATEILAQGAVFNALRTLGAYELLSTKTGSPYWLSVSNQAWRRYLAPTYGAAVPGWFEGALWEKTQGLEDLVSLVCSWIANKVSDKSGMVLTREQLDAFAGDALHLDVEYLDIIRQAARGKVSRSNIHRFADYLPCQWSRSLVRSNDKNADFICIAPRGEDAQSGGAK
ncbi:hypothetical protein BYI23_A025210 [Burkholderia sp. YI23]|nr:hypothetical protein BYI23_A025210 [Burkholderia sp. YI23]